MSSERRYGVGKKEIKECPQGVPNLAKKMAQECQINVSDIEEKKCQGFVR
jgi:hypothetical protein